MDADLGLGSPDDLGQTAGARAWIDQNDPARQRCVTIGETNPRPVLAAFVEEASAYDKSVAEKDGTTVLMTPGEIWASRTWIGE